MPLQCTFPAARGDRDEGPRTATLENRRRRHAEAEKSLSDYAQQWWDHGAKKSKSEFTPRFSSLDDFMRSDVQFPEFFWRWVTTALARPYKRNDNVEVNDEGRALDKEEAYSIETVRSRFREHHSAHNRRRPQPLEDDIAAAVHDYIDGDLKRRFDLKDPPDQDFAEWDDVLPYGRCGILGQA